MAVPVSLASVASGKAVGQTRELVTMILQIYDHILTFQDEVKLIWRKRISVVSVVFLLNRYIIPIMLARSIASLLHPHPFTAKSCQTGQAVTFYLTFFSFMSIHYIAALRVHALYGGQKWIGKLLLIAGTVYFLSTLAVTTSVVVSIWRSIHLVRRSCVLKFPTYMWALWFPTVIFEILLFWLTARAAIRKSKTDSARGTLQNLLVRDEILYFTAVYLCSLFSLVCALADPHSLMALARNFTTSLSLSLVNVAGSRLVLNLKMHLALGPEAEEITTLPNDRGPIGFQKPPDSAQTV